MMVLNYLTNQLYQERTQRIPLELIKLQEPMDKIAVVIRVKRNTNKKKFTRIYLMIRNMSSKTNTFISTLKKMLK